MMISLENAQEKQMLKYLNILVRMFTSSKGTTINSTWLIHVIRPNNWTFSDGKFGFELDSNLNL